MGRWGCGGRPGAGPLGAAPVAPESAATARAIDSMVVIAAAAAAEALFGGAGCWRFGLEKRTFNYPLFMLNYKYKVHNRSNIETSKQTTISNVLMRTLCSCTLILKIEPISYD